MLEFVLYLGVFAVVQLLVHESAHALVVMAMGGRVTAFKPYPHRHNGQLYFGRVGWTSTGVTPAVHWRRAVVSKVAPTVVGLLQLLGLFFMPRGTALYAAVVCVLVDTCRGLMLPRFAGRGDLHQAGLTGKRAMDAAVIAAVFLAFGCWVGFAA